MQTPRRVNTATALEQPAYTNVTASRAEWLAIVEDYARTRNYRILTSLESKLGAGKWKIKSSGLLCVEGEKRRYRLYWRGKDGSSVSVGAFDAEIATARPLFEFADNRYRIAVETCQRIGGRIERIPSLEHLLGPGKYKLNKGILRKDGYQFCALYWVSDGTGAHTRLGSFCVKGTFVPAKELRMVEEATELGMGRDALGRKVIRISIGTNASAFVPVAVEFELVRGEWMPKPCYDKVVRAFRG